MPIKELITYVTTSLMHKMSKRKQSESSCDYVAIVLCKGKAGKPSWRKDIKMCYYCGLLCHIAHFCYKANNRDKWHKEGDDYAFRMQYETYSCKWIMNSEATKYMTFHKLTFDMYEVFSSFNVHLGDDSIVEAIIIRSIIIEVLVTQKIKGICIKYFFYVIFF